MSGPERAWDHPDELLERARMLLKPREGYWALDHENPDPSDPDWTPSRRSAEATAVLLLRAALTEGADHAEE